MNNERIGSENANTAGQQTDRVVSQSPSEEIIDRLSHTVDRLSDIVGQTQRFNAVMFGDEPQAVAVGEEAKPPHDPSVFQEKLRHCIDRLNGNIDLISYEACRSNKFIGE